MSTKSTIEHGENFHFYREVFDTEYVFLEITGEDVPFNVTPDYAVYGIPKKVWDKIKNCNHEHERKNK